MGGLNDIYFSQLHRLTLFKNRQNGKKTHVPVLESTEGFTGEAGELEVSHSYHTEGDPVSSHHPFLLPKARPSGDQGPLLSPPGLVCGVASSAAGSGATRAQGSWNELCSICPTVPAPHSAWHGVSALWGFVL